MAGGSPKKYASGAWAEAVIAVRDMVASARDTPALEVPKADIAAEWQRTLQPLREPGPVQARDIEERLQKVMDEYAGGISVQYGYAEGGLAIARLHLSRLEHELPALGAQDSHGLLHCHEAVDRVLVARSLLAHMSHRRETRWHCYQERLDYPQRDDARWLVFVNSRRTAEGEIEMLERPVERADLEVVLPSLSDGAMVRRRVRSRPSAARWRNGG